MEMRENVQNCSVVCDRAKRRDFHADAEGSSGEVDINIKETIVFLAGAPSVSDASFDLTCPLADSFYLDG